MCIRDRGFPGGFGPDGLLFTADDPIVALPQGYTAVSYTHLTLRWANALKNEPRIRIHSNLAEGQTWGLAVVSIDGVDTGKLVTHLWDKYRIVITAIGHDNPDDAKLSYRALRVTPNIYTPLEEIDTFAEAMRAVAKNGLPA